MGSASTYHARLGGARDLDADLLQAALELACEIVHAGEQKKVVSERVGGGRSHEARLAHGSTKKLSEPAGLLDKVLRSDKARTDRCT